MSDIIRLLPDSVANQIAAGEVIQRPASVIKELVENAVDAGATDIRIYVKDAGRTLIQVVDNGRGMTETDARMAFERHATSKIKSAEDLFTLRTMGFRGEALPSICAISQVELLSRTADSPVGTRLVINGSIVETQEPVVCDAGTNIKVSNIFFNVPARRKFLKSDSVELSNIMREFERLALVNNGIHMLIDTGSRTLDLRAGSFKQRISDIWKNNLRMELLPVDVDTALVRIHGFVSRPEFARRHHPLQYLIANGRNMRHPYFHKAIMGCFDSLIASDTQPCYFLKIDVDPDTIDVNIHPTKSEIKFEYEQQIWPILQAAVKASLGKYGAVPSIDFNSDVLPVEPLREGEAATRPSLDFDKDYNPFAAMENNGESPFESFGSVRRGVGSSWRPTSVDSRWEDLYAGFMGEAQQDIEADEKIGGEEIAGEAIETHSSPETEKSDRPGRPAPMCVQFGRRYIVTTSREGLLVIDQYRAHLRILFDRYMHRAVRGEQVAQGVMFPETVVLSPEHQAALTEVEDPLRRLGYVLEHEAGDRWRVVGVPALQGEKGAAETVVGILDAVCDGSDGYGSSAISPHDLLRRLAMASARAGAIERGRVLSPEEMEHLVGELFTLAEPARTPDGKPVYVCFDEKRLDTLF